jgi:hypothetical protein
MVLCVRILKEVLLSSYPLYDTSCKETSSAFSVMVSRYRRRGDVLKMAACESMLTQVF